MASEEGFICPYCLVSFAASGKLQSHFVEMHSGDCGEDNEDFVHVELEEVGRSAGWSTVWHCKP